MGKVFRNGNSLAVTVPKAIAHQLHISQGASVEWKQTKEGAVLVADKRGKAPSEIDPEVAKLIDKISRKYKQVWQDLAKV